MTKTQQQLNSAGKDAAFIKDIPLWAWWHFRKKPYESIKREDKHECI